MMANDDENVLKILIATDNHLGFVEKDPVRGNDSLVTFEEILENAKKHEVDFVLLGGDLYHENKPSRKIIHESLALLRNYCLGDKPVQFEFLSDQSKNFEHCKFPTLNYDDPNLKISMPVFSIHGNHDDPTGQNNLCSLDLLHSAGYVNYFGKTTSLENIQISPLLFQKGTTKLALYGLGAIRDRLFLNKKMTMVRPEEDMDKWFKMFVIHQNRSNYGQTNDIPEQFLDDFLDLILWGHEHKCRIDAKRNKIKNFHVTQPGSSIATSLSVGETAPKYCGLLQIKEKDFDIQKIRLETVRQFYMEDIILSETSLDPYDPDITKKMEAVCQEKVENLLKQAAREHTGNMKQPDKPLIRIRVDHRGGYEPFSQHRFGQKFVDRVANPKNMIYFMREKDMEAKSEDMEKSDTARIEDMVKEYFDKADDKLKLQVLTENSIGDAVKEFVDKEEKDAIKELVSFQLEKIQGYLKRRGTNEDVIEEEVQRYKEQREKRKEGDEEFAEGIKRAHVKRPKEDFNVDNDAEMNDLDDDSNEIETSTRGRGRGRGARGARAARGGRGDNSRSRGTRGGRGGRENAAVVADSQRSIMYSFSSSSIAKTSKATAKSHIISDSDDEIQVIEDDSGDDDSFSVSSSVRKSQPPASSKNSGTSKKPVNEEV